MTTTHGFYPAPRPMWLLFTDTERATFALMPGWAMTESEDGFRSTTLTWQNLHNFEAEELNVDEHFLLRLWDSAIHTPPSLDDVLATLHAQRRVPTVDELEGAEGDYRLCFPAAPEPWAEDRS